MFDTSNRRYHRSAETRAIEKGRYAEQRRSMYENQLKRNEQLLHKTHWEHSTDKKIERTALRRIASSLREDDELALAARRNKLRAMLEHEEAQFFSEMDVAVETSADRARRNVAVARQKKQQREQRRQAFVKEMYEEQWRQGCDELRALDSKGFGMHLHAKMEEQMQEREDRARAQQAEKEKFAKQMEEQRIKDVAAEREARRLRCERELAVQRELAGQVERARAERQAMADATRAEQEAIRAAHEEETKNELEARRVLAAEQQKQRDRVAQFNEELKKERARIRQEEIAAGRKQIEVLVEEEKENLRSKFEEKRMRAKEMEEYLAYLEQRKREAKAREADMERLCAEDMENYHRQRELRQKRERDARNRLLADVHTVRAQQLANKLNEKERRQQEVMLERAAIEREMAKDRVVAEQERAEMAARRIARKAEIDAQMEQIEADRRMRAQQETDARAAAKQAQAQYEQFLQEQVRKRATTYEERRHPIKAAVNWNSRY